MGGASFTRRECLFGHVWGWEYHCFICLFIPLFRRVNLVLDFNDLLVFRFLVFNVCGNVGYFSVQL
jgi:hypothetical protein